MVECFCPPLDWSVAERKRRAKTASPQKATRGCIICCSAKEVDQLGYVFLYQSCVVDINHAVAVGIGGFFLFLSQDNTLRHMLLDHRRVADLDNTVAVHVAFYKCRFGRRIKRRTRRELSVVHETVLRHNIRLTVNLHSLHLCACQGDHIQIFLIKSSLLD